MRALTILGAVLVLSLGIFASPTLAGGWAVTTFDELPGQFVAGHEYALGYTIRQHGETPINVDKTEILAVATSGRTLSFPGKSQGAVGHYVAAVYFPAGGTYSWQVTQGAFAPQDLATVTVLSTSGTATTDKTAAVMLEPVMGEIGIIPAAKGYLAAVRKWCDEKGLLLILDEVQTGIGRTGKWFAYQHHGITPDVMTLAKGLGGGVPIGACLASPRADVFEPGDHGSTFGGNPLACTVALSVLAVIERDGLVGHAAEMGELLNSVLQGLGAKEVRGLGLMQAAEFAEPHAKAFQQSCLDAGLIINAVDDNSIRLVPPLIISAEEIDRAQATMHKVLDAG